MVYSPSDTMDTWDEEKLRNVVLSKAGNPKTTTDVRFFDSPHISSCLYLVFQIVCKHFIEAIESQK